MSERDQVIEHLASLIQHGRFDEAAQAASSARVRFTQDAELARLHGIALLQSGAVDAAIDILGAARVLAPRSVEVLCNLASAHLARDDSVRAIDILDHARSMQAAHPGVLNGLGNAHASRGAYLASRDAYAEATRAAPGYLGAWINLAGAELALDNPAEAERILRMILTRAGHPEVHLLLGNALLAQRRHADAETAYTAGLRLAPADGRFHYQLGLVADEQKRIDQACAAFERALTLEPDMARALAQLVFIKRQRCDWSDIEPLSARLRAAVASGADGISPFGFLAETASAAEQLLCARTFARAVAAEPTTTHASRTTAEAVRIGFVSNGFGNHPTGLLTVALFEALHARGMHVQLFSTGAADGKAIERRLAVATSAWHALHGMSSRDMAEHVRAAGIEVLVDLRGWGGGNIAATLAMRPAPVQVNWLAYPGTSGAPWIDYVIADRFVLPDALRAHYSEHVARLPRCFQPSDPTRVVATPPSRIECGLPEHGTVYVSFNNSYKLNRRSMQRMFAILLRVPQSILWLLRGPGRSDEALREHARAHGVDPDRLVFMDKLPHDEYLARYRHADLFLDTTPYNAHTTASDAIWAGCPVLTTPGETFAARVAGSLNHHLGLTELNVEDDEAFVDHAVRIGSDVDARNALHARLAARRVDSGLFDMPSFAGDLAALLERMAERHRVGEPPSPIDGTEPAR